MAFHGQEDVELKTEPGISRGDAPTLSRSRCRETNRRDAGAPDDPHGLLAAVLLGGAGTVLIDLDRKARVDRSLDEVVRAGGLYMREHGSRSRPVIAIDIDAEDVMDSGEVRPRGRATDATLLAIAKHASLRWLSLAGAKVTDAGLASLRGLKKLRYLNLSGTPVTDAGLASLEGLADLEIIDLRGTSVTAAGVRQLHLALPEARIRADVESD